MANCSLEKYPCLWFHTILPDSGKVCYCSESDRKFVGLVKKETDDSECIYCSGQTICHKFLVKTIRKEFERLYTFKKLRWRMSVESYRTWILWWCQ